MVDWNKYIGQYPCYEVDSDFRTFNDVAGCVALIPPQLDTPVLKEVRSFLEKYDRKPKYHGSKFEHNEDNIRLKDLILGKTRTFGYSEPKDQLYSVKSRIHWGLLDSPINLIMGCNQDIKWKKIPLTEYSHRWEMESIISDDNTLCSVNEEMFFKARELGEALSKEEWDYTAMTTSLKEHVSTNWIQEHAWDLTADELKLMDIDKELGLKDKGE